MVNRGGQCERQQKRNRVEKTSGCWEVMASKCKHTVDEYVFFPFLMRCSNKAGWILLHRYLYRYPKLCLFTITAHNGKVGLCPTGRTFLQSLTSWQCCAAMCGSKHTEPHSLCLPDSIHMPPSLLLFSSSSDWLREALIPLVLVH